MAPKKGQADLLALAGLALLALGALAYFAFFSARPTGYGLSVELEGNKILTTCVNSIANLKLKLFNPATNPPATVTVYVKVSNATVAAVVGGKPATLPLTVTLAPGQGLEADLYFSPSVPGTHEATIKVVYTINGMSGEKTFHVSVVGKRCG